MPATPDGYEYRLVVVPTGRMDPQPKVRIYDGEKLVAEWEESPASNGVTMRAKVGSVLATLLCQLHKGSGRSSRPDDPHPYGWDETQ